MVTRPMPTVAARRPRTAAERTPFAVAYLAACLAVAGGVAVLTPDYVTEPMGHGTTHLMTLVGPGNPSHPWLYLLGMGAAMVLAYALLVPALVANLVATLTPGFPPATSAIERLAQRLAPPAWGPKLVLLAVTPLSAAFASYLAANMGEVFTSWHGTVETVAVVGFLLTPLPLAAAAYLVVRDGTFTRAWSLWAFYLGIALLHLGMVPTMLDAFLLGGPTTDHAFWPRRVAALLLVRWG